MNTATTAQERARSAPTAVDYLIASRQCELHNLERFLQMGRLVLCISNLVHSLQRERGASNVFLGSEGRRFGDERKAMIADARQCQITFEQALKEIHDQITTHPVSSSLLNRIAQALHGLGNLPALRQEVTEGCISPDKAVEAYIECIHQLLAVVFEAAELAVDPAIAGVLVALVNLMQGKELAGQERAVGSLGFSRGHFDAALSQRMMHLIDAQERCFDVFVRFADQDSIALWQQSEACKPDDGVTRLRQLGCSIGRYRDLDPALADQWFDLMTRRMDALKAVEDSLEAEFHRCCIEKYTEARHSLAHQENLAASLDHAGQAPEPVMVLCNGEVGPDRDAYASDGVGQRFGRSVFDLVQQQAQRLEQMTNELESAREALADRRTLEKAVMLLMKHRRISDDEAHKQLRKLAMDQGKKLPDVARSVLAMADVLETP